MPPNGGRRPKRDARKFAYLKIARRMRLKTIPLKSQNRPVFLRDNLLAHQKFTAMDKASTARAGGFHQP